MTRLETIYTQLKDANKITEVQKLSRGMRLDKAIEDNWEYSFFFDNDNLKKVEAYNGREFIEQYN